jgi:hypothetical protein
MTNELEKTFFDTFGIEPYDRYLNCTENLEVDCNRNCNCCDKAEDVYCYPEITDRILLELICIIHQASLELYVEEYYFESVNYKELKEEVIAKCKRLADKNAFSEVTGEHIKHQVRTLFEEG